jgi:hypothetical protein
MGSDMANLNFDDLIPKGGARPELSFDDLVPSKPEMQGPPIPADYSPPGGQPGQNGALGASNLGIRQGVTFGFGDELMAGALTPIELARRAYTGEDAGKGMGERLSSAYGGALARERADLRTAQEQHPVASAVGEVAGGVATGGQLAKGGATLLNVAKPTYPAMIGRGAAEGALYGAAHGFGAGEGLEDRLSGAAKGAAIGGVTGGAMGAVGGRMANSNSIKAVPAADELRALASSNYKLAEQAGLIIKPQSYTQAINDITQEAIKAGLDPKVHPGAQAALEYLASKRGLPVKLEELDIARQVVRDAGKSAQDGRVTKLMLAKLDDFMSNIQPGDVAAGNAQQGLEALGRARDLWSRGKKGEIFETLFEKAENSAPTFSGSGYENAVRTRFRGLANNDKAMRGFSEAEQDAIRKVARGGPVENTLRMAGKFAPTGIVSTGMSGGIGYQLGGPVGALALPAMGGAARKAATAMTSRNAQLADALVRSGGQMPAPQLSGAQRAMIEMLLQEAGQAPAVSTFQ